MKKIFSLVLLLLLICSPCYAGVDLDGNEDRLTCAAGSSLNGTTDFTVCAWIKTSSATAQIIIQQRNGGYDGQYQLVVNADGTVSFFVYNGGYQFVGNIITSIGTVADGNWHHILALRSADGSGDIYIDGVQDGTAAGAVKNLVNTITTHIGGDVRDNGSWLDGQITEVVIWTNDLTSDEIALASKSKLKGIPLQIQPANLNTYLPLNDLSDGHAGINNDVFLDLSGNGNNATGKDDNGSGFGKAEEILNYPPAIGQFN